MTCRLGGNFEWEQKSSSGDTVSLALSRFSWGGGGVNERRSSLAYALQSVEERDAGIRSNGTAQGEGLLPQFLVAGAEKDAHYQWESLGSSFLNAHSQTASVQQNRQAVKRLG
eukprot:1159650-Pelagomonas_calceolata.AAC.1